MPEWDADVVVDEALVQALLGDQFPELDASSARLLGEGWDNSVWVVEETWVFRFPRREIAIAGVERELAVLPVLAPLLPVPISAPTFVGRATERFRWPFFGAPLLEGVELADAGLDDDARERLGTDLGRFLRSLHDVGLDVELPVDPIRRADTPFRVERLREKLTHLPEWRSSPEIDSILREGERLPPPSSGRVVAHGDLHVRHLLVAEGVLAGVIDWGDVCLSDPAIDLMLVWSALTPVGRVRFEEAYGPVNAEQRLRARVLALFLDVTLLLYARDVANAALERECVAGLERTLTD